MPQEAFFAEPGAMQPSQMARITPWRDKIFGVTKMTGNDTQNKNCKALFIILNLNVS